MAQQYIFLNGQILTPSTIETEDIKIEESRRMLNGTLKTTHTAYKGSWTISWEKVPESVLLPVRTLGRITSPVTFIDILGNVVTVKIKPLRWSLSAQDIGPNNSQRYNIEMELEEI